jgi:hypothetical protein
VSIHYAFSLQVGEQLNVVVIELLIRAEDLLQLTYGIIAIPGIPVHKLRSEQIDLLVMPECPHDHSAQAGKSPIFNLFLPITTVLFCYLPAKIIHAVGYESREK